MEIDQKLKEIHAIQPLLEEVMTYRNNKQLLRKIIKQTCNAEAKQLQNLEINVSSEEMKLPTAEQWPKCTQLAEPDFNAQAIVKDIERTSQAMEFLK